MATKRAEPYVGSSANTNDRLERQEGALRHMAESAATLADRLSYEAVHSLTRDETQLLRMAMVGELQALCQELTVAYMLGEDPVAPANRLRNFLAEEGAL